MPIFIIFGVYGVRLPAGLLKPLVSAAWIRGAGISAAGALKGTLAQLVQSIALTGQGSLVRAQYVPLTASGNKPGDFSFFHPSQKAQKQGLWFDSSKVNQTGQVR